MEDGFAHFLPITPAGEAENRMIKHALIYFVMMIGLASPSVAQQSSAGDAYSVWVGKKVLIVYLSRTGNTKAIATLIHQLTGGVLVQLELTTPYPKDYHEQVAQVVRENNSGFLPPLKTRIDSMERFDVVFIGFPTWDMKMPPPMKSFLSQNDLSGKTVIPFNTNAGYGVGTGFQTVKELCPKSRVLNGFSITGGIERDGVLFVMKGRKLEEAETGVKRWLKGLSID
jgi:flavodoxin